MSLGCLTDVQNDVTNDVMELGPTVDEIMADLRRAGAIGGEETARIVELLLASVEASVRLHLLEALYAAARELEASAAGLGVEIRLEGRDPVLSLVQSRPDEAEADETEETQSIGGYADDELLRITLRAARGTEASRRAGGGERRGIGQCVDRRRARAFLRSLGGSPRAAGRTPAEADDRIRSGLN